MIRPASGLVRSEPNTPGLATIPERVHFEGLLEGRIENDLYLNVLNRVVISRGAFERGFEPAPLWDDRQIFGRALRASRR